MHEPSPQIVSRSADLLLNGLVTEELADETDLSPSQIWARKERPYIRAQQLFCAEIARRAVHVRKERNAALSHFQKLPVELQVSIFHQVLAGTWPSTTLGDLSGVSSHWREIVHGTPTLWAEVDLNKGIQALEQTLRLSGGAPFAVKARTSDEEILPEDLEKYVATLIPHASRCRSISITNAAFNELRPFLECSLPQLEVLNIQGWVQEEIMVSQMPRLRVLDLSGFKLPPPIEAPNSLREISLTSGEDSPRKILQFLQGCPDLETLHLEEMELVDETSSHTASTSLTHLSRLSSLSLINNPPDVTHRILSSVQAHNLTELSISEESVHPPSVLPSIIETDTSPLITNFASKASFDRVRVELGGGLDPSDFSIAGVLGQKTVFKYRCWRSEEPNDVLAALRAMRGLFGTSWSNSPAAMTVEQISDQWDPDFLSELWELLDVTSLTFDRTDIWSGLVDSLSDPRNPWPKLEEVTFPDEPLQVGGLCPSLLAAAKLIKLRGGGIHGALSGSHRGAQTVRYSWRLAMGAQEP